MWKRPFSNSPTSRVAGSEADTHSEWSDFGACAPEQLTSLRVREGLDTVLLIADDLR